MKRMIDIIDIKNAEDLKSGYTEIAQETKDVAYTFEEVHERMQAT